MEKIVPEKTHYCLNHQSGRSLQVVPHLFKDLILHQLALTKLLDPAFLVVFN